VHLLYITLVRPNAEAILAVEAQRSAAGETFVQERSMYIVLRDYEQESCFILAIWSFAIMGYKIRTAIRERGLFESPIINVSEGTSILPEDTREYARPIQALSDETREYLLPRALLAALMRFASTRNVHDVSETVKSVCEGESERLDSELSMVRYIAWAIPAIGFVGTVRGIGDALGQAYRAVQGDIAGVTASLGTAFNSTFVALVLSIVLMFLLHQLQMIQDRLVQDTQTFCDQRLIRHMQVR
jgi:biopolymer transport protein ExbB/TolQ